jgi:hypothetical protein
MKRSDRVVVIVFSVLALLLALASLAWAAEYQSPQTIQPHVLPMLKVGAVVPLSDGSAMLVGMTCQGRDCYAIGFTRVLSNGQVAEIVVGNTLTTMPQSYVASGVGGVIYGVVNFDAAASAVYVYHLQDGVTVFLPVVQR